MKELYGEDQDGGIPYGLRLVYEVDAKSARLAGKQGDQSGEPERRKEMGAIIDAEIERLTELEKALETSDQVRIRYETAAAVIPGREASDRLLRYETHLSREIDRILNRLERLQRMRKGQPLPPQVDVNIS